MCASSGNTLRRRTERFKGKVAAHIVDTGLRAVAEEEARVGSEAVLRMEKALVSFANTVGDVTVKLQDTDRPMVTLAVTHDDDETVVSVVRTLAIGFERSSTVHWWPMEVSAVVEARAFASDTTGRALSRPVSRAAQWSGCMSFCGRDASGEKVLWLPTTMAILAEAIKRVAKGAKQ